MSRHLRMPLVAALLALLPLNVLSARPLSFDLYALLRAERWADVRSFFVEETPEDDVERYAHAEAIMAGISRAERARGFSSDAARAMTLFLSVVGVNCASPSHQGELLACLNEARPVGSLLGRLALWKAAGYARDHGYRQLEARLLELVDPSTNDPLTEKILIDRLTVLYQGNNFSGAAAVARSPDFQTVQGPLLDLWRGRAVQQVDHARGFDYYLRAIAGTRALWLQNAITADARKYYPEFFAAGALSQRTEESRAVLLFSDRMTDGEIQALKRSMTPVYIVQTTNAIRVRTDGIFLIRAGYGAYLQQLSRNAYTHLSHNPEVMHDWARLLYNKREYGLAQSLIELIPHNRLQNPAYWSLYLTILKTRSQNEAYFNEVLAYLKQYPADYSVGDQLIEILIGSNAGQIHWAPEARWTTARDNLPAQTGSGRFLYWLKRYYIQTGNTNALNELYSNFYARSPGSFYAGAFWETNPAPGDFVNDWGTVNDRDTYLRWVSRHGGNPLAMQHLSRRNIERYLDPRAQQMWKNFESGAYRTPEELVLLYRLGEGTLANEFFEALYEGRLSQRETLARRADAGARAGSLPLSVYFTRQLARAMEIPEDPYSMPEGLLKALYPKPYRALVSTYAQRYSIEEEMVYALMRQESLFRETAISRSGARGLMQIMPRTGNWLAQRMRLGTPDLMDVETNINLGAKYFGDLIRDTGDFRWASIAYNGGPGNLRRWKAAYFRNDDFYLFLENIPREEPRNYCRITYQNYMHYRTTYTLYPE